MIRPDGHVAYAGAGGDDVGLAAYLDGLFALTREAAAVPEPPPEPRRSHRSDRSDRPPPDGAPSC